MVGSEELEMEGKEEEVVEVEAEKRGGSQRRKLSQVTSASRNVTKASKSCWYQHLIPLHALATVTVHKLKLPKSGTVSHLKFRLVCGRPTCGWPYTDSQSVKIYHQLNLFFVVVVIVVVVAVTFGVLLSVFLVSSSLCQSLLISISLAPRVQRNVRVAQ